jgi:RHS repeat-associated protein
MTANLNNTWTSGVTYNPANQMTWDGAKAWTYNNLLRATQAGHMTYNYSATQNNGQITSSVDAVTGETITYQHDALERLLSASGQNWGETYTYDGFGNMTQMAPTGTAGAPSLSVTVDPTTNRLAASGTQYDSNGNLLTGFGGIGLIQDAANRVSEVQTNYTYAVFTYSGNPEIQLTEQSENVYFLGKLVSAEGSSVTTDRLGSVRSGGPGGLGYQAQFPYGAEYTVTANDREKYATYTRDSVTGLNYAMNRYYSSQWGRFLSPDPSGASITPGNPQSWNRYTYAGGDPANGTDPSGLYGLPPEGPGGPGWPGGGPIWGVNPGGGAWGFGFGGGYGCMDPSLQGDPYRGDAGLPPWTFGFSQPWCGQGFLPWGWGFGGGSGGGGVLQEAVSNAMKALHSKNCGAVFNTKANLLTVYDPSEVLEGIVDGIQLGEPYFGSLWADQLPSTFLAVTNYGNGQYVGGTYEYTSANIILQDSGHNSYLLQGPASLALTLIHELGHVFNIVATLGGSAIQYDANPNRTADAAAQAANAKALAPCAKALGLNQ